MTTDTKMEKRGEVHALSTAVDLWSAERLKVIRKLCAPATATDAEFEVFIEVAKRWELDPIKKEIFLVPRRSKVNRNTPQERWEEKHEPQVAESGILARADRFPDFGGIRAAAVYQGDTISIDQASGTVEHKSDPLKRVGKPIGAWAYVVREGRQLPVEWVDFAAYYQQTAQWDTKGPTMIVKCARAAALRRAYPNTFGDYRADEEMRDEPEVMLERVGGPTVTVNEPTATRESVREKVKEKVASARGKKEEPVDAEVVDEKKAPPGFEPVKPLTTPEELEQIAAQQRQAEAAEAMKRTQAAVDAAKPPSPVSADAVLRFGGKDYVGKPIASLNEPQVRKLIDIGTENVAKSPGAKWAPAVEENLLDLKKALAGFEAQRAVDKNVIPGAPTREPGSDDGDDVPF